MKHNDWKEVANGYYDKAMSLAVLFLLFAFLVSPKLEVKPYERREVQITDVEEIPPEIREKIKPPEEQIKPEIEIIIDDSDMDDDDELEIVISIDKTTINPFEPVIAPKIKLGETPKLVIYDDPPEPISRVHPKYPAFYKNAGIEGPVWLEVEVLMDGSVGAIEVIGSLAPGPGGLDEKAVEAVRKWEFTPAKSGGTPVACWVTFPIEFKLE
ncbi:MAG: TonB family protein [Candidatus Cloacimonetes bacterium]|nr:TonB family protein [Candidatus Cloacimonadota bacterium]